MVKRIISVLLSVAVIAGFAYVCSAAKRQTDNISGLYVGFEETCSFNGAEDADKLVLAAEVLWNFTPLKSYSYTWESGPIITTKSVSVRHIFSNMGYHTGYYMVGSNMYYNEGYDD